MKSKCWSKQSGTRLLVALSPLDKAHLEYSKEFLRRITKEDYIAGAVVLKRSLASYVQLLSVLSKVDDLKTFKAIVRKEMEVLRHTCAGSRKKQIDYNKINPKSDRLPPFAQIHAGNEEE